MAQIRLRLERSGISLRCRRPKRSEVQHRRDRESKSETSQGCKDPCRPERKVLLGMASYRRPDAKPKKAGNDHQPNTELAPRVAFLAHVLDQILQASGFTAHAEKSYLSIQLDFARAFRR